MVVDPLLEEFLVLVTWMEICGCWRLPAKPDCVSLGVDSEWVRFLDTRIFNFSTLAAQTGWSCTIIEFGMWLEWVWALRVAPWVVLASLLVMEQLA